MSDNSNWQKKYSDYQSIKQGSPSSYWSKGLEKRFQLLQKHISLRGKKILDAGCGIGMFMEKFSEFTNEVYGFDVDKRKVEIARKKFKNVEIAGEGNLPYKDNSFDIVWSHEVLEHTDNDTRVIKELIRVLKAGGKLVIFTPNRMWPFETHGVYVGGKYKFGNIPLVTYLPDIIYKKMTPHVKNYSNRKILKLFKGLPIKVIHHSHVFPGFDGLERKFGSIGKLPRILLGLAEKTPLHNFGISHFLIVEKV